jgi:hypothetical protein
MVAVLVDELALEAATVLELHLVPHGDRAALDELLAEVRVVGQVVGERAVDAPPLDGVVELVAELARDADHRLVAALEPLLLIEESFELRIRFPDERIPLVCRLVAAGWGNTFNCHVSLLVLWVARGGRIVQPRASP